MNGKNYKRCCLLMALVGVTVVAKAQSAPNAKDRQYYQFYISYNHADSFRYDNYYYLKEKDFWSFDAQTRSFNAFADDIFDNAMPFLGELNTEAGVGIRIKNSHTAHTGYPVRVFDHQYLSTNIYDSSAVTVIALGINKKNAAQYEYRLAGNKDSVIKNWTDFTVFRTVPENGYTYAYIGTFSYPKTFLRIEIRNKKSLKDAGSIILNWLVNPLISIEQSRIYYKDNNEMGTNGYLDAAMLRNGYASGKDSITGVLKELKLPGDKEYESFIFDLKDTELTIPYTAKLVREINGKTDTVEIKGYFNDASVKIPSYFLSVPGKYNLLIGSSYYFFEPGFEQWILNIPYEILPVPMLSKKWTLGEIIPVASAILVTILLFFYFYYRFNKRKLKRIEMEKQLNSLQLKSLQDQLNPHFLFNALSAIQNLVGKNDIQNASLYLQRFALLTRTILTNSRQEMISIEDELMILKAYLEMEQLRTYFSFLIEVGGSINTQNVEIPVMLLQPFVENAVKHGVSSSDETAMVKLSVTRENESLIFLIEDNGKGIDNTKTVDNRGGWGLDILKKRINLLNERFGDAVVSYEIRSGDNGTLITVYLKNWLT